MERVHGEWECHQVPAVDLRVHRAVQEVVDVGAEVREHRYHIGEVVHGHGDLRRERRGGEEMKPVASRSNFCEIMCFIEVFFSKFLLTKSRLFEFDDSFPLPTGLNNRFYWDKQKNIQIPFFSK